MGDKRSVMDLVGHISVLLLDRGKLIRKIFCTAVLTLAVSLIYILIWVILSQRTEIGTSYGNIITTKEAWRVSPYGIAVDSRSNLYLGAPNLIMVYSKTGEFLHSFRVHHFGDMYYFSIDDGDNLEITLLAHRRIVIYNHEGVLLEERKEDLSNEQWTKLHRQRNTVKIANGETYKLTNFLGYTQVRVSDGDTTRLAYRIPLRLYLVKCAIPSAVISLVVVLGYGALTFWSYVYECIGYKWRK